MSNYRNPKLLALAEKCPRCMGCGDPNDGTIVAAHSNRLRHGKGRGLKAHDLPAYLCIRCHAFVDGGGMPTSEFGWEPCREDRASYWADAMFKTFLWLLEEGHLVVK